MNATHAATDSPATTRAWYANRWVCLFAWSLVIFALVSGVVGGLWRGLNDQPDWRAFVKETSFVWAQREIAPWTGMFGYLPGASFLLWPFTVWLPKPVGLIAFVALNGAAAVAATWLLFRYWFQANDEARPTPPRIALFGWPLFVLGAHFQNVLQGNQLTIFLLFLCVCGLTFIQKARPVFGGFLLGVAGCLKVTPALLVVFLLLKRRWLAVLGMVLAFLLIDVIPSIAFFGFGGAVREHRAWLDRVGWYSNRRFIEDPWLRVMHHGHEHNTSLAVVLTRWLREQPGDGRHVVVRSDPPVDALKRIRAELRAGDHLSIDPMPEPGGSWSVSYHDAATREMLPRFSVASWSANRVWLLWLMIEVIIVATAIWRTAIELPGNTPATKWQCDAALWLLISLWPSPMLRDYYLPLALPAAIVVWRTLLDLSPAARRSPSAIAAAISLVLCFVSVLSLASDFAEWYGIHLAALAGLTLATLWCSRTFVQITSPPVASP